MRIKEEIKRDLEVAELGKVKVEVEIKLLKETSEIFNKKKVEFALKEDFINKEKESIERQKDEIKQDRLHLYSQQQSLKYAYEEAKRKLEEVKKYADTN